eukprot:scpid79611/ scgid29042/ Serine/threonine-protein kinase SBK1; SH3-binding kinase 1
MAEPPAKRAENYKEWETATVPGETRTQVESPAVCRAAPSAASNMATGYATMPSSIADVPSPSIKPKPKTADVPRHAAVPGLVPLLACGATSKIKAPPLTLVYEPRETFATEKAEERDRKMYRETIQPTSMWVQSYEDRWSFQKALTYNKTTKVGVNLVTLNENGEECIMKFRCYDPDLSELRNQIRRSNLVREMLVSMFVAKTIGCQYFAWVNPQLFLISNAVCFEMEYCEHRDLRALSKTDMLSTERLRLISEAARGLEKLHSLGLVHFDVKLSNIGVSQDAHGIKRAKLIDLGSTKVVGARPLKTNLFLDGDTNTYRCPELWALRRNCFPPAYSLHAEVDMWALGICVVRLFFKTHHSPWKAANGDDPNYADFIRMNHIGAAAHGLISDPPMLQFSHADYQQSQSWFVNYLASNLLRVMRQCRMSPKCVADRIDQHLANGGE